MVNRSNGVPRRDNTDKSAHLQIIGQPADALSIVTRKNRRSRPSGSRDDVYRGMSVRSTATLPTMFHPMYARPSLKTDRPRRTADETR